jgi:hypothetical protein
MAVEAGATGPLPAACWEIAGVVKVPHNNAADMREESCLSNFIGLLARTTERRDCYAVRLDRAPVACRSGLVWFPARD